MIFLHPKALDMLRTMRVIPDSRVHDIHMVKRSLYDRLTDLPWTPFTRYKQVYCPSAYILKDGTAVVSYRTYNLLQRPK